MGLATFNRMRRQRNPVSVAEAEKFMLKNEAANKSRRDKVAAHKENRDRDDELRKLEAEATARIGDLVKAGLDNDDIPMRREHAAEIAGRNLYDVQGDPKDPVARVSERIPDGTVNEQLPGTLTANGPGPDPAVVKAARIEAGVDKTSERDAPSDTRVEAAPQARKRDDYAPSETGSADAKADVDIPANWRELTWPRRRSIAAKVSDDKIKSESDASAAIEAELRRRG